METWNELTVKVNTEDTERAAAICTMAADMGIYIEDYSNIEQEVWSIAHVDLIEQELLERDRSHSLIHVYIKQEAQAAEAAAFLDERLTAEGIDHETSIVGVNEEDWANNWKQYYKPLKIGNRIVICPAWETYTPTGNELVVRMDPGMAFGTGTHETTRLMIRLLEDYTQPGCRMLDVGTGTGILAICASRLGAGVCRAYDIDPTAVRVARENIRESGLTNITCDRSDLLRQVDLHDGRYDLITANIVADILIRMMPDVGAYLAPDGVLLLSGIVEERCADPPAGQRLVRACAPAKTVRHRNSKLRDFLKQPRSFLIHCPLSGHGTARSAGNAAGENTVATGIFNGTLDKVR